MVRLARLPTRVFADGSFARGVAVEDFYGLARLTVHEAELSLDYKRDPNAGEWVLLVLRARRQSGLPGSFVWYQLRVPAASDGARQPSRLRSRCACAQVNFQTNITAPLLQALLSRWPTPTTTAPSTMPC